MVLPYAALNAPAFAGLRRGDFGGARVGLTEGWSLEKVRPLFQAQSGSSTTSTCVLIGQRDANGSMPAVVTRYVGTLPRRDATEEEAERARHPWSAVKRAAWTSCPGRGSSRHVAPSRLPSFTLCCWAKASRRSGCSNLC